MYLRMKSSLDFVGYGFWHHSVMKIILDIQSRNK